jgi:excisionase family DNA binding protein
MPRLLNVKEIATELGVVPTTIQVWCRQGKIPYIQLPGRNGHEYRFDVDEVRTAFTINFFVDNLEARALDETVSTSRCVRR